MKAAHEGHPTTEFPKPSGIVTVHIDPVTGLLAYAGQTDGIDEDFLEGTAPTTVATFDAGAPDAGETPPPDAGPDDESSEGAKALPDVLPDTTDAGPPINTVTAGDAPPF
jgi:penicillin-binding protein 1A